MWGTKASTWTDNAQAAGSMKWHLVDETSFEERTFEIGWGQYRRPIKRTYGLLDCGRKGGQSTGYPHAKIPLVFKEKINLAQANICAHCKKARMRELGIESQQI